ncbi:XdhC/CoxI family protein [Streptomyces sp. NBC_01723]|uniref:XdhC family protein n=1 Tax=Streptomyces sp. NBC_01723 TaxID=2975921 RepID=UPI002E37BCC6|nr:XdhC family protein [Streptomyces sp. NBC_01723]
MGLTCGGTLEVFVEPVNTRTFPELAEVIGSARSGIPVAVATVLDHPRPEAVGAHVVVRANGHYGSLHPSDAPPGLMDGARELLRRGDSGLLAYDTEEVRVFVRPLVPPARMLLFGAGDFAAALAAIGRTMDYRVTVCDARPLFGYRRGEPESRQ